MRYSLDQLRNLSEAELLAYVDLWQEYSPKEILSLLDEINQVAPVEDFGDDVFDCCGTGGDRANTFNISTTAAFVAAAAGVKICKNGGRNTTSTTGSVDVLEALGLNLSASTAQKQEGLKKYGLAFYSSAVSAELLAPVKQTCRKYKRTSFLSLLAPLASPVKLKGQVIGIGQTKWLKTLQEIQIQLIAQNLRKSALLIYSSSESVQLDELSSATKAKVIEIYENHIQEFDFDPGRIGLQAAKLSDLIGANDHSGNAKLIHDILSGKSQQAKIDTTCLNSAALLYLSHNEKSSSTAEFNLKIKKYFDLSLDAIKSGKALNVLYGLKNLYSPNL